MAREGRNLDTVTRPLLLALALAAGCAPRGSGEGTPRSDQLTVGEATVRVIYWPEDAGDARRVLQALRVALPRTARWGGLERPVTITIHPTHAALERAAARYDYPWLKAWARDATIELQAPATWSFTGASDRKLAELLTHELTHCVMYQRSATDLMWSLKGTPLWFIEGMASHTAAQAYRRGTLEDLWRHYRRGLPAAGAGDGDGEGAPAPGTVALAARGRVMEGDPLADSALLYLDHMDTVYGAAHHAFAFLLERYGEDSVHQLLRRMRGGLSFDGAFKETYGIEAKEFVSDFRHYVVWEGWRR